MHSDDGNQDFIPTDASIKLGNFGGAPVSLGGQLIGINSIERQPLRAPQDLNNLEYPRLDSPGTSACCAARNDCTWKHGSSLGDLPGAAIDPRRAGAMLSDLAPSQHPGDLPAWH